MANFLYLCACNGNAEHGIENIQNYEGHQLAFQHCKTCHQFPKPELLDKKTWLHYVLPKMGGLSGFRHFESASYFEDDTRTRLMTLQEWNKIVRYYVSNAPSSPLKRTEENEMINMELTGFKIRKPVFSLASPATTYIGIRPHYHEALVFGDGMSGYFYTLADGKVQDSFLLGTGISNITYNEQGTWGLTMGVMHPSDERSGSLKLFPPSSAKSVIILDSLQRPVYAEFADLNNDTLEDIIVCEFGNNTGQLSWFENKGGQNYKSHVLRAKPGAVKTAINDFNKDGKPDVMALMAQGDEGVFIYTNEGKGIFKEERILEFPPSYGSNYFELADVNKDGFPDIVATNGDNGDYPPVLKAYHGIRVYINDGTYHFKQQVFLPVNGVCKAIARDFDGDGDMDIASIAYFPDYDNMPEESFIYWENKGNLSFKPYSFPEAASGRWLTMDAGDMDGDGDTDIVLGNAKFSLGRVPDPLMQKWNQYSPSLLILENVHKK